MAIRGYPFVRHPDPLKDLIAFGLLLLGLSGLEALISHLAPRSAQSAQALHEQLGVLLRSFQLSHNQALFLALLSGVAEEVAFRGALQNALGGGGTAIFAQALLFALLHPAPPRAWTYPLYAGVSGLLFGLSYLVTQSLVPGILAHYLHNAQEFYALLDST